ncbi:hypothetical protein EIP91_010379 [Steccherinum ochraceum]|uniref:Ubiquitin 3 binding protein But2 C-terminal domain-containing protein n=1 Tax=Steccherinum ochraceum TaxID=92696 RepID=A0A4R0RJ09_9APHY|nr:hypothetical protein EIP91_010379 [Steccherinum ochraceum]
MSLFGVTLVVSAILSRTLQAGAAALSTNLFDVPLPFTIIVSPTNGTTLAAGQTFNFEYPLSIYGPCPSALYPIAAYLLDHVPTSDDVTVNDPTQSLFSFGEWIGAATPLSPGGTTTRPPPTSLTMPELSPEMSGETIYFVVVQTMDGCVGHQFGYGVSYSAIRFTTAEEYLAKRQENFKTPDATPIGYGL